MAQLRVLAVAREGIGYTLSDTEKFSRVSSSHKSTLLEAILLFGIAQIERSCFELA